MNISYNWLKDLIDIDLPSDELGRRLTGVGLAVEGIHAVGEDQVFDIDLTSNRPDCLSHLGVAREIAVFSNRGIKQSEPVPEVPIPAVLAPDVVRIDDPDLCHRFTARIIKNVKIGPSPQWLVERLEAIGERSINNVADITNYVMHELGQPMHAFDLDKLTGNRIIVRRAKSGETITTLDEADRQLDASMLAICDSDKPVAVAGVMGGLDSSITDNTVNVLLEVAYFVRESIRQTSRKLDLATEASYRFERGVDIQNLIRASNRASELITDLANGEVDDLIDVYPTKFAAREIVSMNISAAVGRLVGIQASTEDCLRILNSLGVESDSDGTTFIPPSWRHDLAIEEDLVEEIARHVGYDSIATQLPPAFGAGEYQPAEPRKKLLRQTLVDLGFNEALSYSFIDTKWDDVFQPVDSLIDPNSAEKYVTLQDSVIEGAVRMRPSLLPGLIDAVRLNFNHQQRNIKLFELGKVFAASSNELPLPNEQEALAIVLTGGELYADRAIQVRETDFYDVKGAVEAALNAAGTVGLTFIPADVKHLRRGQSASVSANDNVIGYVGRLNDDIAASFKFRQAVFIAEINLSAALAFPTEQIVYRPIVNYPSIIRDVSFVAGRAVAYADIRKAVIDQGFELCRNVMFVDVYEGKGLAEHERSITIRLEYRSDERTLIEDEVEGMHAQILSQVESSLGIKVRY